MLKLPYWQTFGRTCSLARTQTEKYTHASIRELSFSHISSGTTDELVINTGMERGVTAVYQMETTGVCCVFTWKKHARLSQSAIQPDKERQKELDSERQKHKADTEEVRLDKHFIVPIKLNKCHPLQLYLYITAFRERTHASLKGVGQMDAVLLLRCEALKINTETHSFTSYVDWHLRIHWGRRKAFEYSVQCKPFASFPHLNHTSLCVYYSFMLAD